MSSSLVCGIGGLMVRELCKDVAVEFLRALEGWGRGFLRCLKGVVENNYYFIGVICRFAALF